MRQVETRTADDFAVLQDLPRGQRQYAHSFPVTPTFDALSYFRLDFNGSQRDTLSFVHDVTPITFTDPRATSHADVVVFSLRNYHASYLPDSTDSLVHIAMDPLPALTRGNDSTFFLHDLYVDTATNLPTQVSLLGSDRVVHLRLHGSRRTLADPARDLFAGFLRSAPPRPRHGNRRCDQQ